MSADIFVYLDTVQFSKNGLQNRNQIKSSQGSTWLTVPVKHQFGQAINETEIANRTATAKHWKTFQANYAHTRGLAMFGNEMRALLEQEYELMGDLAIASTEWMLERMNIKTRRLKASKLTGIEGESSERVASICRLLAAETYLTGKGALSYLAGSDFEKINCRVEVQEWKPFEYSQ